MELSKNIDFVSLTEIRRGEEVIVSDVACAVNKQRLLDLGIYCGVKIAVKGFAPLGDPIIIEVGGFEVALRKNDAKNIVVERRVV